MPEAHARLPLPGRVAIAVAIAVAGVAFVDAEVKDDVLTKRFGVVVPDEIFRSGKLTPAAFRRVVDNNGVRTIVDFGAWEPGSPGEALARAVADELGVDRVLFDLHGDATGDPNAYVEALRIMTDPERQPVLVHCGAGTERTGCAVILYRHLVEDVPLETAYAEAERAGHSPARNPRLREVLDRWLGPIAEAFDGGGSIDWTDPGAQAQPETSDR